MAKFEKGHKLATGRPKGAVNRSTEQAKLTIARIANRGLDNISEDLEKIRKTDPIEATKLYLKLLEYIVPKKAQMELSGQIDQRIQQISINVNRTGSELRD
jgi:16S rRNA C1402 N4-methylase RsmH